MKIKDVISKTGLTDRAIRLYIENGLVSPASSESYTGRKNIDFSEDDVAELCNIAILRKAGFSISEIKLLQLGGEACRKTLEEFMKKTASKIESDKIILEKLEVLATKEAVTPKDICESLTAVTKEKAVPVTDTKLTLGEKFEKRFFTFSGVLGLIYIFGCILYVAFICKFNFNYLYPTVMAFDLFFFAKLFIVLFVTSGSTYLLLTYCRRTSFTQRKKRLVKNTLLFQFVYCYAFLFSFLP